MLTDHNKMRYIILGLIVFILVLLIIYNLNKGQKNKELELVLNYKRYFLFMKKLFLASFLLISSVAFAQNVTKLIKEKIVKRIINTLSADKMMGRSAMEPTQIEPATVFIESEFEKIGLKPLKGLTGYRQSFQKEQISPSSLEVILDGEKIAESNLVLVSEKTGLNVKSGLTIQSINYDKEVANKDQYFFDKALR